MTREESIKILSILKAAYPNSYKGMSKEEANGTVNIWASQFSNIPYFVVAISINKLISKSTFPPSISEVKSGIKSLYWEAWATINGNNWSNKLDDKTILQLEQIMEACSPAKLQQEQSLVDILSGAEGRLLLS